MYKSRHYISLWSAVALGIGTMVGAGIFSLLGEAGAIADSAVYLSFLAGGVIALLSGYSLGKLGARYPSAGGIVEYLVQCWGEGVFSGSMSVMLYISAVVSISLVARTFGSYGATFLPQATRGVAVPTLAALVILVLMLVNLRGVRNVTRLENLIVAVKFSVLVAFAIAGLWFIQPERLAPSTYPPVRMVFFALAVTFFAYEGFRVITNTAEDMENPAVTLPRAMTLSILLVMALYVAVAIAVFGNLPTEEVVKARDYALAEAARPVFGAAGFTIVSLAALVSTASAINASLYAVTNVTYQMAKDGQLPQAFGVPIAHSREGLVISSVLIALLAIFLDLGEIAAIGSISVLLVHGITHLGHLRKLAETGASRLLVVLALVATLGAVALSLVHLGRHDPLIIGLLAGFIALSVLMELSLRIVLRRTVRTRTPLRGVPAKPLSQHHELAARGNKK